MASVKTVNLTYSGANQTFTIPTDCGDTLTLDCNAGGGGFGSDGAGGRAYAWLPITEALRGTNLTVVIGGKGNPPSGTNGGAGAFGGGGAGGNATGAGSAPGYSGAGATDIRQGGTGLAQRILVAGGAGSTGRNNGGHAAGGAGGASTLTGAGQAGVGGTGATPGGGGGGGTNSAGGAGGTSTSNAGQPGVSGVGGGGSNTTVANRQAGGGGGGGYFGGGEGGVGGTAGDEGGGGGGGSNFFNTGIVTNSQSFRGGGAAAQANGTVQLTYWPTPQAPTNLFLTSVHGLMALQSTAGPVNPDLPIRLNWTYNADTFNNGPHWRSKIEYSDDVGANWHPFDGDTGEVKFYLANDGAQLSAEIPAGSLQPNKSYLLRVKDKNIYTDQYSQPSQVVFTTPARPATPAWVGLAGSTLSNLPLQVAWTATGQVQYRIAQFKSSDTTFKNPLWDSGWRGSSIPAALINALATGLDCVMALWISDGFMQSLPATATVTVPGKAQISYNSLKQRRRLEVEVYDGLTGIFISGVPNRINPTFLEELRGTGSGSFTLRVGDPLLTTYPTLIKARNIVKVKDGGRYIGFWIMMGIDATTIATDEGVAEALTVRGPGGYGVWPDDAVIYPEHGNADFASQQGAIGQNRAFGAMSDANLGHWSGSYLPPVNMAAQSSTAAGNPWRNSPANWPADLVSAQWIWDTTSTLFGRPGVVVFKTTLINSQTFPIALKAFMAADDEAQLYLNGDPWLYSNSWSETAESDIMWIEPGTHQVTAIASQGNYNYVSGTDDQKYPAGLLIGVYSFVSAGSGSAHAVTLKSDTVNWVCKGYPNVLPSWTVGDILQQLYKEINLRASAVGHLTSWQRFALDFDEVHDSYGVNWAQDGTQWFFPIGDEYGKAFDKLTDTACDIWYALLETTGQPVLRAARERGVDRSAIDPPLTYQDILVKGTRLTPDNIDLVTNPGFETNTTGWVAAGTPLPTIARITTISHDGVATLRITSAGTATALPGTSYSIPTKKGATYKATVWAYAPAGSVDLSLYLVGGGSGTNLSGVRDQWVQLTLTFTATADTHSVGISQSSTGAGQVGYIDTLSVIETTKAPKYLFDFVGGIQNHTVGIGVGSVAVETLPPLIGANAFVYNAFTSNFTTDLTPTRDNAKLLAPALNLPGIKLLSGGFLAMLNTACWGAAGEEVLPVNAPDALTMEWLGGHNTVAIFEFWKDTAVTTWSNGGLPAVDFYVQINAYDDAPQDNGQFGATLIQITSTNDNAQFIAQGIVPRDAKQHHWAMTVTNVGTNSQLFIYLDGLLVVSHSLNIGFTFHKVLPFIGDLSLGYVALHERALSEDELVARAQQFKDNALTSPVEPVIFGKAKNVQVAQSSIDYAGKTLLVTRTKTSVLEVKASLPDMAKYGRIEGYYDGSEKDRSAAHRVAIFTISSSLATQPNATIEFYGTYIPGRDYGVGDWVLAPDDITGKVVPRRIMSLSWAEDPDTGETVYAQEIDSLNQEAAGRIARWLQRSLPSGNLGGLIADQG